MLERTTDDKALEQAIAAQLKASPPAVPTEKGDEATAEALETRTNKSTL